MIILMHPWLTRWSILINLYIFGYYIILVPLFLIFCSVEDFANVLHCEKWQEWMYPNIVLYVVKNAAEWSLKYSHSLTTLMPRDLAEPMMLLTTFCIETSRSLKLSSCDLTRAISYTALTVTIPAVSCPAWRNKAGGEREGWWNTVAQKEKPAGGVVGRDWEKWKWRWSEGER